MKQRLLSALHRLTGGHGMALIALVVLGLLSVMPNWANAQSDTTSTFTSPLPGPHRDHGGGPNDELRELLDTLIDRDALLADVLGITVDELTAARESGVSVHELIDQAGLDEESVRAELQSAVSEAVQQAVTDGVLTQEQADAILNPPTPPHPGAEQGHNGHHQRSEQPDDTDGEATPTPTTEATPTAETTATAEATTTTADATVDNASTTGTEHQRPHHNHAAADQNSDTETSGITVADTTSSATAESAANDDPPTNAPRNHADGNRRPGR